MESSFKKQTILFLISLAVVIGLFCIPVYNKWLEQKLFSYYAELLVQSQDMSIDTRYLSRFGNNYVLTQNLKTYFEDNGIKDPILFLPPKAYLERNKEKYDWGECLSFYYFTGIASVDLKSSNIHEATHAIIATADELKVIEISDESLRARLIEEYTNYSKI